MLAHVARADMAGIDRRIARGEHRNDRRLGPFQMEGRGQICVSSDRFDVLIPRLAWIGAELLRRLAEQQVPGTFDVIGSERAAVVPFDTPAQTECQLASRPRSTPNRWPDPG